MKLSWSILLQDYVTAEEVGYDDCREFQIVCPSCFEAVFKAGTEGGKRQYLSHYAQSKVDVDDCELRVSLITKDHLHFQTALSRGQQLELFQKSLSENLVRGIWKTLESQRFVSSIIENLTKHETIRSMAREGRGFLKSDENLATAKLWKTMDSILQEEKMLEERRCLSYSFDLLSHILSPNSFKSFLYVFCVGIVYRASSVKKGPKDYHVFRFDEEFEIFNMIVNNTGSSLKRYLSNLSDKEMSNLMIVLSMQIPVILLRYPYFDVIRENRKSAALAKVSA